MKINNNLVNNQVNTKANVFEKKNINTKVEENSTSFKNIAEESIQLSQKAKAISETKETFDKVKIQELKQAILDGSYQVDSKRLATNIYNFEKLFGI